MKLTKSYIKQLIKEQVDAGLEKKVAAAEKSSPLKVLKVAISKKTGTNKVKAVITIIKSLLDDDPKALDLLVRNISVLKTGLAQADQEEPQEQ